MYNRNYNEFDYILILSELLTSVLNRKYTIIKTVTDHYTRPIEYIQRKVDQICYMEAEMIKPGRFNLEKYCK